MSDDTEKQLLHHPSHTYGDTFRADILEQYKLYVQSAENVSARRVASSRYLLTLNTGLIALYGLMLANFDESYWVAPVPLIGFAVSVLWYLIIRSHAALNSVKFKVIHELEQQLPAALYAYEWYLADEGRGKAYRAVTSIESWIPVLFAVLHVGLAVVIALAICGILGWPP